MKYWYSIFWNLIIIGVMLVLPACSNALPSIENNSGQNPPVKLVFYDWEDDIPIEVLDDFTKETGIFVEYAVYETEREVETNLYYRNSDFDVIAIDNDTIPLLVDNNLLAEMNYESIPNFKYISINFRDLLHDPENKYSIPFNWGTTGIIYLNNEEIEPPDSWADLWNYPESVRIGLRHDMPYDNLAFTKQLMSESINECDPEVLERVSAQFLKLKENIEWVDIDSVSAIEKLDEGEIDMLVGWSDDIFEAQERGLDAVYILPEEGTMLWGDSFVITARSRNKDEAAQLINFLLDPKVSAKILEYNNYASANDSVKKYLSSDLVSDPIIYPGDDVMRSSEIYMPVSDECNKLQLHIWDEILEVVE